MELDCDDILDILKKFNYHLYPETIPLRISCIKHIQRYAQVTKKSSLDDDDIEKIQKDNIADPNNQLFFLMMNQILEGIDPTYHTNQVLPILNESALEQLRGSEREAYQNSESGFYMANLHSFMTNPWRGNPCILDFEQIRQ